MKSVIGLGTNIGDRLQNLEDALTALELLPNTEILKKSSVYETKPYGYTEQADFLNMAVEINTVFPPRLFSELRPSEHKSPRHRRRYACRRSACCIPSFVSSLSFR